MRIFDASGNLLRQISGGTASLAVGSLSLGMNPWDPLAGPLAVTDGAWSGSYDGRDSQGNYLANGIYLIEVESQGSGPVQKSTKNFIVLLSATQLVSSQAWPNPAGKGSSFVIIAWTPLTQEVEGKIYNQAGELVLDLGRLSGGQVRWELKNASSGVYFAALRIPGERHQRVIKVALTR